MIIYAFAVSRDAIAAGLRWLTLSFFHSVCTPTMLAALAAPLTPARTLLMLLPLMPLSRFADRFRCFATYMPCRLRYALPIIRRCFDAVADALIDAAIY